MDECNHASICIVYCHKARPLGKAELKHPRFAFTKLSNACFKKKKSVLGNYWMRYDAFNKVHPILAPEKKY